MNKIFNFFFNKIWNAQIRIMKGQVFIKDLIEKEYYIMFSRFLIGLTLAVVFICGLLFIILGGDLITQTGFIIFAIVIIIGLFQSQILKFITNIFISIKKFFIISVILNGILSLALYSYYPTPVISITVFSLIYFIMCLLSNSKVANTSNTIIEIFLGLVSLTKEYMIRLIYSLITSTKGGSAYVKNDVFTSELNFHITNLSNRIDNILYPILIINGIALFLCIIHSYWICKYNDNEEITWNEDLRNNYIKQYG